MTEDDLSNDTLLAALARLPAHAPEQARANCIRELCQADFAKRNLADMPFSVAMNSYSLRFLEPALVAVVGAIFLAEVLTRALRLYGL